MNSNSIPKPDSINWQSSFVCAAAIFAVLLLTYFVYKPGISGPFLLDDFSSLSDLGRDGGVNNLSTLQQFVFGNTSGPTGRPISMLSFLIDANTWPVAAAQFKYTNILLHLLAGLLLGWFSLLLFQALEVSRTKTQIFAFTVSAVWLLHPLNVSTTLYVVQRMTQLMTIFSLAALVCYLKGIESIKSKPVTGLILLCLALFPFGLLAVLSKENGALLLAAIVAIEFTVFANARRDSWFKLWLIAGVALPLIVMIGYMLFSFSSLTADYAYREFTLPQRMMTESRIVCDYFFSILFPRISEFGLFHDDIVVSSSVFSPFSTLLSIAFIISLIAIGIVGRIRFRVMSFAIFWFLGWHLLESSFLPLELYFEHRNYLPMMGVLIAIVYYTGTLVAQITRFPRPRIVVLSVALPLIVYLILTLRLTLLWGDTGALISHWSTQNPDSVRAQLVYVDTLGAVGQPKLGYEHLNSVLEKHPREATLLVHSWNYACNYDFEPTFSLQQIARIENLEFLRDDINFQVRVLIEHLIDAHCEFPQQEEIIELMNTLSKLPMRAWDRANFHFLFSDVYVHYRLLTPALVELRKAFDSRSTVDIPIRQAILSASAGNLEDSLIFLERAREADLHRSLMLPSRLAEIAGMEQDLRARLDKD